MIVALRDMEWTDIPELVALDEELFVGHAWPAAAWWAELGARPQRRYVVAAQDGALVGYYGLDLQPDVADVMTIGVSGRAQGAGLGRRLLDDAVEAAQERGCEAMLLEVRADNDPARRLYDRAGFAQIGVRRRYYQPEGVDALVLRKLLGPREPAGEADGD